MIEKTIKHQRTSLPSLRSFGLTMVCFFLFVGLWPLWNNTPPRYGALGISFFFLASTFLFPKILNPLNILWYKLGILLHKIISPIIISLLYFCVIVPIGCILKIMHKDLLQLKFNNRQSYWESVKEQKDKGLERQF